MWGGGADEAAARSMFERFAEAGGTFIDTADMYQDGESEQLLAKFLAHDRDHFVVATKFGLGSDGRPRISTTGNSRKNTIRSLEGSLRRLGTDHVDLLWVHWPDPLTPLEETMAALDDLVRAGKVLHIGLSNFPAWRAAHAATLAELRGWAPLTGLQFEYSLVERTAERELLPMADAFGLGTATWSPLGGGLLTGKYRQGSSGRLQDWDGGVVHQENTRQKTVVVDTVLAIAEELDAHPAQVATAWLLQRSPGATSPRIPIVGPRTLQQLDTYLGALRLELAPGHLARLNRVSAVPLGAPHEGARGGLPTILGGDPSAVALPPVPAP
ncbi:aryl-alcohol dehydrogenase-like predicted oxidoreductase [Streptomyces sp. SFB5A]|uniref:Aryl-alcohol dehydrogenase-like predicted oxidoreductase n=1 Tax=Streptomyces nymphaeiformis TaxID=2663842 RepID=A0A7W7TYG3_9ACTN|nr:aryl-alcohol dehydrogenase-like predicted oxidoreductase [Streptomyces nymphaeiformis]